MNRSHLYLPPKGGGIKDPRPPRGDGLLVSGFHIKSRGFQQRRGGNPNLRFLLPADQPSQDHLILEFDGILLSFFKERKGFSSIQWIYNRN